MTNTFILFALRKFSSVAQLTKCMTVRRYENISKSWSIIRHERTAEANIQHTCVIALQYIGVTFRCTCSNTARSKYCAFLSFDTSVKSSDDNSASAVGSCDWRSNPGILRNNRINVQLINAQIAAHDRNAMTKYNSLNSEFVLKLEQSYHCTFVGLSELYGSVEHRMSCVF